MRQGVGYGLWGVGKQKEVNNLNPRQGEHEEPHFFPELPEHFNIFVLSGFQGFPFAGENN